MAILGTAPAPAPTTGYTLLLTDEAPHVAAAQCLRARQQHGDPTAAGLDTDDLDSYCDHLVVRHDGTGEIVAACRVLPPPAAARAGQRDADAAFDLRRLEGLRSHLVEAGRSCVHPAHRHGAVLDLLWAGVVRYLHLHGLRWLGAVVPVPLSGGVAPAAAVWRAAAARHYAPAAMRVHPWRPWLAVPGVAAAVAAADPGQAAMPALLRGYLRLGGWVCGEPAHDARGSAATLYVLLAVDRIAPRYRRHLLGGD
ncbi:MAG TPA: GNAT family N-acyltransferase [Pilimelia sp.]|nr:GNAT family N-acyltransferase [Pilimelia sp.]